MVSEWTSGEPGTPPPATAGMPVGGSVPPAPPAGPAPAAYPVAPQSGLPYPVTAAPFSVVPPPQPRRGPWVVVLGILTGVLLLTSGGLGALYYLGRDEANRKSADQQAQIADLQERVGQLEDDLDETERQLQRAEDDLADAEACPDAVQAFIDLSVELGLSGGDPLQPPAELQQAVFDMVSACGVAI